VAHGAQPRQPGHGVVQTGSPLKRPDPRPFKEQTTLSHCRHNTTEIALCKINNLLATEGRRGPRETTAIPVFCSPGPLTGRFSKQDQGIHEAGLQAFGFGTALSECHTSKAVV